MTSSSNELMVEVPIKVTENGKLFISISGEVVLIIVPIFSPRIRLKLRFSKKQYCPKSWENFEVEDRTKFLVKIFRIILDRLKKNESLPNSCLVPFVPGLEQYLDK